jgi:class 3 adenylate cyclase
MALDTVRMNRFTLAFDDARLEREFLDDYADSVRLQVRAVWLMALVFLPLCNALDAADATRFYVRVVRFSIAFPAEVLALAVTWAAPGMFRRSWAVANGVALSAVGCCLILPALVCAAYVPAWHLSEDLWAFFIVLVFAVFFILAVPTVGMVRFFQASALTAAFTISYVLFLSAMGIGARGMACGVIFPVGATLVGMIGSYRTEHARRRIFLQQRSLAEEHEKLGRERMKSEALLLNVLPAEIAERLKSDPSHIADGFSEVTILFADIVGFTDLSARLSPAEVVAMLNLLFTAFDDLAEKHGLEKIKTIGDAYMVVGGLPEARPDHAEAVVAMALGMRDAVAVVSKETGHVLKVRIGANSGPVVAGVIGKKKFAYDLWGDAVNTASRMESHGLPGEIQVTEATWAKVKDVFEMESRGTITVKGKGDLPAWFVRGRKVGPPISSTAEAPG